MFESVCPNKMIPKLPLITSNNINLNVAQFSSPCGDIYLVHTEQVLQRRWILTAVILLNAAAPTLTEQKHCGSVNMKAAGQNETPTFTLVSEVPPLQQ